MPGPSYDYFGTSPVTIVMQTTDNFDGAAQTGTPTLNSGVVVFPAQAGGGLMNMHHRPIKVTNLAFTDGGGNCTFHIVYPGAATEQVIAVLTPSTKSSSAEFILPVGASLKAVSTGTAGVKQLTVTAHEVWPFNAGL